MSTELSRRKDLQLPINRIKTIMKSSPDVETIGQEALFVVTKCTELFIQYITTRGLEKGKDRLEYKQIADFIETEEAMNFLTEILPQKMTVSACKEYMKEHNDQGPTDLSNEDTSDEDKDTSLETANTSIPV